MLLVPLNARAETIYVSMIDAGEIWQFDESGGHTVFATGLTGINGVAVDSDGNLYVSCGREVDKFDSEKNKTVFCGGLQSSGALAFDGGGNLFMADTFGKAIYKIDAQGIKEPFATTAEFPISLAVDKGGNVYVASGSEITKYDPSGAPAKFASGLVGATGGMAFNSAGELFVVNDRTGSPTILKFDTATGASSVVADTPNIGAANRWPGGLAFGSDGTLYIPTQIGNTILALPANAVDATVFASTEGTPSPNPGAIAISKQTKLKQ